MMAGTNYDENAAIARFLYDRNFVIRSDVNSALNTLMFLGALKS